MREKLEQYVDGLFVQKRQTRQMQELHDEILQNSFDRYDDAIARGQSPEEAYRAAVDGIGDLEPIFGSDAPSAGRWNVAVAVVLYITSIIPPIILSEFGGFFDLLGAALMFVFAAVATGLLVGGGRAPTPEKQKTRTMRALAIMLYILCVVPPILTSNGGVFLTNVGVCLMFLMIAAATSLIILSSGKGGNAVQAEKTEAPAAPTPPPAPQKSLAWRIGTPLYWIIAAMLFFAGCNLGLWMYAWIVFPLFSALEHLIVGCIRMAKGGHGGLRAATGLLWLALLTVYVYLNERTGAWLVTWLVFPIGAALRGILSGIFELVKGEKQ